MLLFNTFTADSTPAGNRLIDLTLEGRGLTVNVLKIKSFSLKLCMQHLYKKKKVYIHKEGVDISLMIPLI